MMQKTIYTLTGFILFGCNLWAKNIDHKVIIKKVTESGFVKFIIDRDKNGHLDKEKKPVLSFEYSLKSRPIITTRLGTKFQMNSPRIFIYNSLNLIPFYLPPGVNIPLKYSETDSVQFYVSDNPLDPLHTKGSHLLIKNSMDSTLNHKPPRLSLKPSNTLLLADGKSTLDFQDIITKHKGEFILLDFWASWCVPCRGEMPYLDSLKKQFKGKNIAFLSISLDKDINSWLKAHNEESLTIEDSFLLLNPAQSPFINRYGIYVIPRYLLISKNGKVMNENAPRPSDKKLAELIDKNLTK